jgi:hypothetical protein
MNTMSDKADDRQEIESLLPWHAAGTLSRRDAERVERALASDQELASRFDLVREELAETIHLNESLGAPSARALEKLFAAIDAEGAMIRKPSFSLDLRTRMAEFFAAFAPRTLAYAGGAAALVILLQAGVIGSMVLKGPEQSYGTASAPDVKVDSIDLYINFVPKATTDDVTKFLRTHDAKIVDGPKGVGTYVVRFAASGTPKEETSRVLNEMKQSRDIVSSEFEAPLAK